MDKSLKCVDGGAEFVFTEGDQEFYASHGFSEPRRCPECRAARKATKAGQVAGNVKAPRNVDADQTAAASPHSPRQMYSAVCAECGKETQVPFQPNNGRPVYCSDCYRANGGSTKAAGARPSSGRSSAPRSNNRSSSASSFGAADFDLSSFADVYPPPSLNGRNRKRDRGRDRDRNRDRDRDDW